MNTNVTLPRRFEMKNRGTPWFFDENWITNGKFAINKQIVKEPYKYCLPVPGVNHPEIDKIIPCNNSITITKTNRIIDDSGVYVRIFINERAYDIFVIGLLTIYCANRNGWRLIT